MTITFGVVEAATINQDANWMLAIGLTNAALHAHQDGQPAALATISGAEDLAIIKRDARDKSDVDC